MVALLGILSVVGNFLKKIPWQLWLLTGVLVVYFLVAWASYERGKREVRAEWLASIERGRLAIEELKKEQLTVNMVVDSIYEEKVEYIYAQAETIVKQIPVYIPSDTPDLPGGFRVLHDAAVDSALPGASEGVEAAPIGVAEAAETITMNYALCHRWRAEVESWRQWYTLQAEAHSKIE